MDIRLLQEERDRLVEGRAFLGDFVLPEYDTNNIKNIKLLAGKVFGEGSLGGASMPNGVLDDFGGVEKILLIVADGFGYNRLLSYVEQHNGHLADLIAKGVLKPFTSAFPATTSTSLTSIFSGLAPAEHGVLGYQMYSPQYGCVVNTLEMKPVYGYSAEVEIGRYLSKRVRPWMPALQEHGIQTVILTRGSIMGSGLSRIVHAGVDVIPYSLESEMFAKCHKVLEQPNPVFLVLYYSGIDTLEHKYGPYSDEVTDEIQAFEFLLGNLLSRLSEAAKRETLLMLTSDHGVQETKRTCYVKDFPDVWGRLQLPPVCDSRCGFLFAKQGEKEGLRQAFEGNIDGFRLVVSGDLIEKSAFGDPRSAVSLKPLIGDWAALSKGPSALSYPYYDEDRNREQIGGHGGMTAEEILVPLLSMKLAKA